MRAAATVWFVCVVLEVANIGALILTNRFWGFLIELYYNGSQNPILIFVRPQYLTLNAKHSGLRLLASLWLFWGVLWRILTF